MRRTKAPSLDQLPLFNRAVVIGSKSCIRCGVNKPLADFATNTATNDGKSPWCKECHGVAAAEYRLRRAGMNAEDAQAEAKRLHTERQRRWMENGSPAAVRNSARKRKQRRLDPEVKKARSEARAKEREKRKRERRKESCYWLRYRCKTFGITEDEFWGMWYAQQGRCPICRIPMRPRHEEGRTRRDLAVIDHCHDTGRVRAILCSPCNLYIGMIGVGPAEMVRGTAPAHTLSYVGVCRER